MPDIAISEAFKKHKSDFLKWWNERGQIKSAIMRLERRIACETAPPGRLRWAFFENTHEEDSQYATLGCVVIINPLISTHAPCWLFFPAQRFGDPLPKDKVAQQMRLVLDELGW